MRIQWNKLGCTEKDYLGVEQSFQRRQAAYICPNCGLEIYSEWNILIGPKDTKLIGSTRFSEATKLAYQDKLNMQDEAISFSELDECPCCAGKLKHEKGFFVQVETAWSGHEWEKSHLFFKNNICHYAPNWSILGTDAAWEAIWRVNTLDKIFTYLNEEQQSVQEKLALESVAEITTQYDVLLAANIKTEFISSIKSDIKKLQEYFSNIINVEKNIQLLKQRLFFLYSSSFKANKDAKFSQCYPIMAEIQQGFEAIEQMRAEFKRKSTEITELINLRKQLSEEKINLPTVDFPIKPIEPTKPTYATPNIFNKKKVVAENEALTEKYNNDVVLYNKALSEYPILLEQAKQHQAELHRKALKEREKEICELDEKISKMISELDAYKAEIEATESDFENRISQLKTKTEYPAVQLKISLDKEIETAEELLKDLFKKKHQLYGADIIFGKYRDIAAVTSFYEYLISGRCETLEGVNGCYNLYESELRANLIINKLDAIGDSLEIIKGNQYMLYSQLSEINHELSSLNVTTTAMLSGIKDATEIFLEHSSVIAYNSAVSAYYSKLNAEIASCDRYISMICW